VADMKRQPDAVFVIDLKKEQLGIREAQRLGIPVIGLVDTNADPDEATYVIPGNDDAMRSCNLVTRVIADAISAGKTKVSEPEMAATAAPPTAKQPAEDSETTEEQAAEEPQAAAEQTPDAEAEAAPAAEGGEAQ
jgi:small subunit ribosomal protein S2